MSDSTTPPAFRSRRPRPGERLVPLSGGRYYRHTLGDLRVVGEVDEARGVVVARSDTRNVLGWSVEARAIGKRSTKPYIRFDEPFVTGLDDRDYEDLLAAAETRRTRIRRLKNLFNRSMAAIDAKYIQAASRIQARIDCRLEPEVDEPDAEQLNIEHGMR